MRLIILPFAALCLLAFVSAGAQPSISELEYGPVSSGTDFYVSFPTNCADPSATQHYIRLYIANPELTMLVSGVDFGPRALGTTAENDAAMSITNIGGPDVRIVLLVLEGDTGNIHLDTAGMLGRTIASGSTVSAAASFTPTGARGYTLSVRVAFDPDQGGEFRATIRGHGVDSSSAVRSRHEGKGSLTVVPVDGNGRDIRVLCGRPVLAPRFDLIAVDGHVVRTWEKEILGIEGEARLSLEGLPAGWYRLRMKAGTVLESATVMVR